jgi:hypothetical protein
MMGKTHRAWSGAFWLGTTLVVNEVFKLAGFDAPFHPVVILAGFFIAPWFSAGRYLSPDIDHRWAPGPPRGHYHWRYHRGFTHRVWFATLLTGALAILPFGLLLGIGVPSGIAYSVMAPINGWWSHIVGDMIYGRILISGRAYGLGWETGGDSEFISAGIFVGLASALSAVHLYLLV